ncbi:hypothetical protein [Amycolatopsis sp. MEPSY49]|uniref:hypothetical protein n=1 Tax=Amycolatopsis sp. MEPSY49 TaxID=3151600 RepID=UPI003EF323CF
MDFSSIDNCVGWGGSEGVFSAWCEGNVLMSQHRFHSMPPSCGCRKPLTGLSVVRSGYADLFPRNSLPTMVRPHRLSGKKDPGHAEEPCAAEVKAAQG